MQLIQLSWTEQYGIFEYAPTANWQLITENEILKF